MTDAPPNPYDKPARLSTGEEVNLGLAAELWEQLQTLNLHPKERAVLLELRGRALDGSAFEAGEAREAVRALGFADEAGRVTPAARAVVLSATHGDLENVHVVSPFTDWGDRFMAEFLVSADAVKVGLRPEVAERVMKVALGEKWIGRIQSTTPPRDGFSPN